MTKRRTITRGVAKGLLLLLLPLSEFVIERILLRRFAGVTLRREPFSDVDLLLPACFAFVLYVFLMEMHETLRLKFRPAPFLANGFSFAVFLLAIFLSQRGVIHLDVKLSILLLVVNAVTACLVFLPLSRFLKNEPRFAWVPCLLIAGSIALYITFFGLLWRLLLYPTGMGVYRILRFFLGDGVQISFRALPLEAEIMHPNFGISLQNGCGGVDALFLFSFSLLLALMAYPKLLSFSGWLLTAAVGLLLMFLTNIARISLFFIVALKSEHHLTEQIRQPLVLGLFHTHIGWILYVSVLISYFSVIFRMGLRRTSPQ